MLRWDALKRMKINHEEITDNTFVVFVSSWLIFGGVRR